MRRSVWTVKRKAMGNVVPALIWAPFTIGGAAMVIRTAKFFGPGLYIMVAGQVLTLLVLNYTGHWENRKIRAQLLREVDILRPGFRGFRTFVGFSEGNYSNILDPHQDVGFLLLTPETLEFIGDGRIINLGWSRVFTVHFSPNIHSWLGLGRWVTIEGRNEGKLFRYNFEPRERNSLVGNMRAAKTLRNRLLNWMKKSGPPAH